MISIARRTAGVLLTVGALVAGSAAPAFAARDTITGGGAGSGSEWVIDSGTNAGGTCVDSYTASGLLVEEGTLDPSGISAVGAQTDAYDGMAGVYVGGSMYNPSTVAATTSSLTGSAESLANLDVTVSFTALRDSSTLRQLVTLSNPGASDVETTVDWAGNYGSDTATQIIATGSGDTAFSSSDSYLVTADSTTTPSDPVNTVVFYGSGGTPTATTNSVLIACQVGGGGDSVGVEYAVTVPAGATRYLVVFLQMDQTIDEATAAAPQLAGAKANSKYFRGLSKKTFSNILNWDLGMGGRKTA